MTTHPHAWIEEFPAAITVCDTQGVIVAMNARSAQTFAKDGGRALIGKNLLACHSPQSAEKLAQMLETQQKNVYTIEKQGVKKMIFQSPWYQDGQYAGLVEISLEIPEDMPHFQRA